MVVVLVAVAAWGTWRFNEQDQPSWKGATFGMFARVDNVPTRVARAYVVDAEGEQHDVALPSTLEDDYERTLALPTPRRVSALAEGWSDEVEPTLVWSQFVMEVLAIDFDSERAAVQLVPLRQVRVTRTFG